MGEGADEKEYQRLELVERGGVAGACTVHADNGESTSPT